MQSAECSEDLAFVASVGRSLSRDARGLGGEVGRWCGKFRCLLELGLCLPNPPVRLLFCLAAVFQGFALGHGEAIAQRLRHDVEDEFPRSELSRN